MQYTGYQSCVELKKTNSILLLDYKSQDVLGSEYVKEILTEYKLRRALRFADSSQLTVQRKDGEAAFSCYAGRKWNKMPTEVEAAPSLNVEIHINSYL